MVPDSRSRHPVRVFLRRYGAYLWLGTLLLLAAVFIWAEQDELRETWRLLLDANRFWLGSIVVLEIIILALLAGSYKSLLGILGHTAGIITLVYIHLQRIVVGTVTPAGGPASVVVYVHELWRRGIPAADGLMTVWIKSVLGNAAFIAMILPVFLLQEPSGVFLIGTIGLIALVSAMTYGMYLALRPQKPPRWFLRLVPRKGLRFVAQLRRHNIRPLQLVPSFLYLTAHRLLGVLILYVSLRALGAEVSFTTALIAYVVGMIFLQVAPIFQGIGFVEVGMTVALQQQNVPVAAAVGATLLTRVGELWLPVLVGLLWQTAGTLPGGKSRLQPESNRLEPPPER